MQIWIPIEKKYYGHKLMRYYVIIKLQMQKSLNLTQF